MKTLTLRLTEEFHKELKIKCVQDGVDMTNYIISLIKNDMEKKAGDNQ